MRAVGESIRFPVEPRDVPAAKAARRLHLTVKEFEGVREELFQRGFPHPDPTTGMYDLRKIDMWMDARDCGDEPGSRVAEIMRKHGWGSEQ